MSTSSIAEKSLKLEKGMSLGCLSDYVNDLSLLRVNINETEALLSHIYHDMAHIIFRSGNAVMSGYIELDQFRVLNDRIITYWNEDINKRKFGESFLASVADETLKQYGL